MTEFDTWLQAEERKRPKSAIDIVALTYGMIVFTAIVCLKILSYRTFFAYMLGGGVLAALVGLGLYYHFVIRKK